MASHDHGVNPERLDRVAEQVRADIEADRVHGVAMKVSRGGEVVVDIVEGFADKSAGTTLNRDATFLIMSTSKPMTNALVLSMVEQGKLRLHTPVAEVIPEFGHIGKESVNLYHLLTHTSGAAKGIPPFDVLVDLDKVAAYAGALPPEAPPGQRLDYSMVIAHSIIGAMCVRADGGHRSFSTMMSEEIFQPLGMHDTSVGPRDDLMARLCPVRLAHRPPGYVPMDTIADVFLTPGAEVPAGNIVSTISDVHRFTEMLRRGGELDGSRILSPAMIKFCTQIQTGALVDQGFDGYLALRHWLPTPANMGVGFRVRGEGITPGWFGVTNSPNTFGHFGAGSTGLWVDPDRDLSWSFLSTGLLEETHSMERMSLMSDLVLSALVE